MTHINVEIKARCGDPDKVREVLRDRRAQLHGCDEQVDTYFRTPRGRLKLRRGTIETALIYYERPVHAQPRTSHVRLYHPADAAALQDLLSDSLGVRVVVRKRREIYFLGNIKIHLDEVHPLGKFVEIEAMDSRGEFSEDQLQVQCRELMQQFGIQAEDLIGESYGEMLLAAGCPCGDPANAEPTAGSIEAVIFDLGRVIVDVDVNRLAEHVLPHNPDVEPGQLIRKILADDLIAAWNTGRIEPAAFHRQMCDRFGLNMSFEEFREKWCSIFSPIEGMEPLIRQLSGRVRLGLLSDTDPLHWEYLQNVYPILGVFKRPVLSFQAGVTKPDPGIFRLAVQSVATEPQHCLFIDDLPRNVQAAQSTGMQATVFAGAESLRRKLTSLGLLPDTG